MNKILLAIIIIMGYAINAATDEPSPVSTVEYVDLERYCGLWYEIARLPNKFQRKCESNTTAEYSLREDGKLRVVNRCRKADGNYIEAGGIARLDTRDGSNAKLKVRFAPSWIGWLPFVWGKYWIIDLADDYSYAVVGEPSRKYLWILSRKPELENAVLDQIIDRLESMGYDTVSLIYTEQNWPERSE